MSNNRRGAPVASNEFGRFDALSMKRFVGTVVRDGREETKIFCGGKDEAIDRWLKWQRQQPPAKPKKQSKAEAPKPKPTQERTKQETRKETTMDNQTNVYVLRYIDGSRSKDVAAYADQDNALNMAIDLKSALEIAGASGEYTVEQIPLRR